LDWFTVTGLHFTAFWILRLVCRYTVYTHTCVILRLRWFYHDLRFTFYGLFILRLRWLVTFLPFDLHTVDSLLVVTLLPHFTTLLPLHLFVTFYVVPVALPVTLRLRCVTFVYMRLRLPFILVTFTLRWLVVRCGYVCTHYTRLRLPRVLVVWFAVLFCVTFPTRYTLVTLILLRGYGCLTFTAVRLRTVTTTRLVLHGLRCGYVTLRLRFVLPVTFGSVVHTFTAYTVRCTVTVTVTVAPRYGLPRGYGYVTDYGCCTVCVIRYAVTAVYGYTRFAFYVTVTV